MKHLMWVFALSLTLAACSKEESVETTIEEAPVAEDEATNEDVSEATESVESTTEILQVVEESAAVAEPEDKAILLALAASPDSGSGSGADNTPHNWQFKEGKHYTRLVPTQPTVGGADKIEVAEVFMYSCPACLSLETPINTWAAKKDPNIRFVRIPATFNQLAQIHAQLYYTEEVLARNGLIKEPAKFRAMVFAEYHRRGNRLASEDAIQKLFARGGVSEDDFKRTWGSFEVNQKLHLAADLARRYNVQSVPLVVVNGKYRVDGPEIGSYATLMNVVDELTVREGLR